LEERINIDLKDARSRENMAFANLVDPAQFDAFIRHVLDVKEKRTLPELVKALLDGR
jgi:hypothetical protein